MPTLEAKYAITVIETTIVYFFMNKFLFYVFMHQYIWKIILLVLSITKNESVELKKMYLSNSCHQSVKMVLEARKLIKSL